MKDSGGDITKIGQVLRLTDDVPNFQVLAGSASFLYAASSLGASGGVCALANVLGEECVNLFNLTKAGEHDKAVALQKRLIAPNQAVTRVFGVPGLFSNSKTPQFNCDLLLFENLKRTQGSNEFIQL